MPGLPQARMGKSVGLTKGSAMITPSTMDSQQAKRLTLAESCCFGLI